MQQGSVLERIKKDLESLSPQEQLELIEGLVSKLRKSHTLGKKFADWVNFMAWERSYGKKMHRNM